MEAHEGPRRFSASSALVRPLLDDGVKRNNSYGTIVASDTGEEEALLQHDRHELTTSVGKETRLLIRYSVPLCITYVLQYSFSLVTIFVVGHIGTDELGAVSLATMTANITGLAVYEGLATSLDTLCAQAYGGGRKEQVGLHMQRMVVFMLLLTVPIGAVWLCSGWILAALVPEKELAYMAGRYLRILLAGAPGYAIFEAGKRFTQAQGLFNASLFVLILTTPINILLNYLFVFVLDWDLTGAALSTVISNTLLPLFLWIYVYFIVPSSLECWGGFTRAAFTNWGPMCKLSVPGIVMVEAEWLAFDILTFSSSYLSTAHLAAQSVIMTTAVMIYHIPFSTSVAVSTRLGNLIGAGALPAARIATRTYILIFLSIGLLDATFLTLTRHILPRAFTSDPEVIRIVASVMPILALFQLSDAGTALANAVLRGLGRQDIGGYVNLGVYYLVAIPTALALCFGPPKLDLKGMWTGCLLGSCLIWMVEGVYCRVWRWEKAVEEARGREGEPQ
ncbi:MATE efflux family protein [Bimuria novae-zelandiae CBS 107.79]|uniref:MATE efflux family protein n=1 Tax=Bimuria novae-zelandiae CBS 107.79 TaxID=1447943 RepID=A0A6A5VHM0_9PLEO|nr:MATE efflux family protein [Bimuria novae-zelandiae CBS 107.79]